MKIRILEALVVLLVIVGGYCGYRYYSGTVKPAKRISEADNSQLTLFEQVKPSVVTAVTESSAAVTSAEAVQEAATVTAADMLEAAEDVNSAVVGWITIPDTHIDYPIVQGEDNDFYLHNGFDGQYNYGLGCPFLDYRCEGDFSGFNSIVYAHNMDGQRMFADIALYKDESFFLSHLSGSLVLVNEVHDVSFFAYMDVPSTAPVYDTAVGTDSEKQEYISYLSETAMYKKDIFIDENSHLLLLSTCTLEYDEARGVLVGVIE